MVFDFGRSTSPGSFPWQELTVSSRGLHGTKCNGYLMGEIIVDQTGFRTLDLLLGALTTELFGLIIWIGLNITVVIYMLGIETLDLTISVQTSSFILLYYVTITIHLPDFWIINLCICISELWKSKSKSKCANHKIPEQVNTAPKNHHTKVSWLHANGEVYMFVTGCCYLS